MVTELPRLISFPKIGSPDLGFISVSENLNHIPFDVKRVFWTYGAPDGIVRGHHAHHKTEMVLIAMRGHINVYTEMPDGSKHSFILDQPDTGVYLPAYCWHTMEYNKDAIQLVLANTLHDEKDYIRSYEDFLAVHKQS